MVPHQSEKLLSVQEVRWSYVFSYHLVDTIQSNSCVSLISWSKELFPVNCVIVQIDHHLPLPCAVRELKLGLCGTGRNSTIQPST